MKIKSIFGIIAGLGLTLGAISPAANAESKSVNTYYCAQLNSNWSTFVNTPRGKVSLINWENSFSDEWSPQKRCSAVSQRFQKFLDQGNLKFIRTGNINQMPVLCVANARGGNCPTENVLVTLKSGTDPEGVLIRLMDFRRSVSGQTLTLSADDPAFYSDGEFYVDMDKFLEVVPVSN